MYIFILLQRNFEIGIEIQISNRSEMRIEIQISNRSKIKEFEYICNSNRSEIEFEFKGIQMSLNKEIQIEIV